MSEADGECEMCGQPKRAHTEAEAVYCITRIIASLTDRPVHVVKP